MDNSTLTTTNIGKEELKHLRKIASHHGLKQVEFINATISYFRKTGINPAEEIYSPREEIERLTKRVDEVIKFMQVHEKQKLSPLLERLLLLERRLSEIYSKVVTVEDLKPLGSLTIQLGKQLDIQIGKLSSSISKVPETIRPDIENTYRTQRNTIVLISLLFECLKNRNTLGGLREIDIKNFENAISKIR